VAAHEFGKTVQWFAQEPTHNRSQLSPESQAILFTMVRNLKPAHAFEIGTFQAGTSEAICRAMQANGSGVLHTTDPFGRAAVPAILLKWPRQLRRHVRFYPLDSMAFFMRMEHMGVQSGLTFVDGRHDYEFAMFDLSMTARTLSSGGFVVLDNVSQPGPFLAVCDFVTNMPGWCDCGNALSQYRNSRPFDKQRAWIPNTDFAVLRGPSGLFVGSRPVVSGERVFHQQEVRGIRLTIGKSSSPGTLSIQCVLRGHSNTRGSAGVEIFGDTRLDLDGAEGPMTARFGHPLIATGTFYGMSTETALVWDGNAALHLTGPPTLF
jgi:predicted O-methyltransferase YrrM